MAAPHEGIRGRVREFARNLRLATFDARVERRQAAAGQPALFYYDTDVVLRIIMGFELAGSYASPAADLVRSLLACFMLGPMHMLRPHALELRNHLGNTTARSPNLAFKSRAQDHLRGHESKLKALRQIVAGPEKQDGLTKAERFIRLFRAHSSASFVAIEQISGHWTQRLKRHYGKSLRLDHLGPEMQELLRSRAGVVQRIFALLEKHRPDHGRENLQDAAALAILSQMVKDRQRDGAGPVVRFYSESPALWNTWRAEPELRALLSYPAAADADASDAAPGGLAVFRDTAYFLARARFRELALGSSSEPEPLDKLERLLREVEATDRMDPDEFGRVIRQIRWEGKPIGEIIQEFEDFSLMRAIWRRIPPELADSLDEWTDVYAYAMDFETGEALVQKISVIRDDLEGRLSHIVRWTGDRTNLMRAALDLHKRIPRTVEDPMRDLGLVRWGYDLRDDEKQSVIQVVDNLMQSAEAALDLQSADLANRMEAARSDVRECLVITAVLWVMRLWPEIDRLVDDCARAGAVPASLRLIQAAARIRSARLDQDAKQALIDRLTELGDGVPPAQRGGYFLGLGYVLYQAWKQELRGAWVFEVDAAAMPARVRAWAARCFEVGDQAAQLLRDADDLAWAYAVNHCAYVGLTTGVEPDRTQRYLLELSELNGRPAIWNARFDDTLGTDFLLRAEAGLRQLDGAAVGARRAAVQKIRYQLDKAGDFLDQARGRQFGDIDVDYHLRRVEVASDQLARREQQLAEQGRA
jgi:hypothetical protein